MFQYACAKAYSLKHRRSLYIDTSFLDNNQLEKDGFTPRRYELGVFGLKEPFIGEQLTRPFRQSSIFKKIKKNSGLRFRKIYVQDQNKGAEQLNEVTPPVLLSGYWQSEQYFIKYEKEIRQIFRFQGVPEIGGLLKEIESVNAVSVHFRRGDYITNPVAGRVLGVLTKDYYEQTIERIASEVNDPVFYLFSDDVEWVKNNFKIDYKHHIVEATATNKNWHDMLMMSKCKHHIIANSSFSWWGAWLNPDPNKIVIAPAQWFADTALNKTSVNITPAEWIRL